MATNNVKSPAASLANKFKAPSLPNTYDAVKPFNPLFGIDEKVVETNEEFADKKASAFSQFRAKAKPTRTTWVGTTSVDVDITKRAQDKATISKLASESTIEARVAQWEWLIDFTKSDKEVTIDNLDIDALWYTKLSVYDAKKRIDDFNNPKSKIAEAFRLNLGERRYEFTKLVEDVKKKSTSRAAFEASQGETMKTIDDMSQSVQEEGITWLISTATTKSLDYAFWQSQYKTNKYAKEYNLATWKETRSPIAEGIVWFWVNAPFYMAMGNLTGWQALWALSKLSPAARVGRGAWEISRTLPTTSKSLAFAKLASNLESMSMKYPTLYAASVDNALTTAVEYTWRATAWMDTSWITSDLMFGAALPTSFKWLGKAWTAFRGLNPKDINNLEKALFEEVQASVDKDPRNAFKTMVAKWETYFEDGTTLSSRIEEANKLAEGEKKRVNALTPEEVISELSWKGITVTKAGGRMIADSINKLNDGIKWDDEFGELMGYGDVGKDGKSIMAKQTLINNIQELWVANEESVTRAIEDAKASNWVEFDIKKSELSEEEQFEELLSNPDNNIENLLDAKNAEDIKAAVEGAKNTKKATKEGLDGLRFATDIGELKLDELQAMADEQGVKINQDKLYKKQSVLETKAPELDKDYINNIIDEIELKRTWYSSTKSSFLNDFKSKVSTTYKNVTEKMDDVFSSRKEVRTSVKTELDWLKKKWSELAERIKNITRADEKVKIQKLIDENNAKIVELKKKATYKDNIKTNFVKYVKNSIDSAGSQYTRSYFRPASSAKQVESAQVAELRWQTPRAIRTTPWYVTETVLSKAKISEIKNKYKALIHPTTTVARATELMKRMDEELHKLSYDKMEKDADDLITKVMKAATNKKTKATVDIEAVMKMADTYIKIKKANGDLDKMRDLIVDLENFYREGKDAFKIH